jgi:hypothetical protein
MKLFAWSILFLVTIAFLSLQHVCAQEGQSPQLIDFAALTNISPAPNKHKQNDNAFKDKELTLPLSDDELAKVEGADANLSNLPILLVPGTLLYSATHMFQRIKGSR